MVLIHLMGSSDKDIFQPDTKWWNKNGLLYAVNEDATLLTVHQPGTRHWKIEQCKIEDIVQ